MALIFIYMLTFGAALASLSYPFVGLLVYVCFGILKPESFWYDSVPAGNYTLTARLKGAGNARQNVTVNGTSAAEVKLTLKERAAAKKPAARKNAKAERPQAKAARHEFVAHS